MKKTVAFFLSFLMIFSLCACNRESKKSDKKSEEISSDYEEKGSGKNQFYLDIFFESDEKHYSIKTDEVTVGAALTGLEIIVGEQGPYGTYISSVEGEEHVYENGGKYWAFYDGGQYASKSVDLTDIENGKTYALKVE